MECEKRHIEQWLMGGMLMLLVLLTACSSSSTEDEPQTQKPKEKPVLKVYLFAPDSPIITRASTGDVAANATEKEIHTIDVWVYEHDGPVSRPPLVSYIHLDNLSFEGQREIAMEISDDFANLPKKPNVDIFVIANKESCGYTNETLNKNTTRAALREICMSNGSFGITSPVTAVPSTGLPMSGLLENQVVGGIPPIYTAKAQNVRLVRAVSKMRFIFSKSTSDPPVIKDLTIKLDANVVPKEEYILLEGPYPTNTCHIKTTGDDSYETSEAILVNNFNGEIYSCSNPASYVYISETGQEYENKIDVGLAWKGDNNEIKPDLTQAGLVYLRETDKKLTGTISYKLKTGPGEEESDYTPKEAPYEMAAAGDFYRNHTWIVYGYFLGNGQLKLNIVDVKAWDIDHEDPKVYNW